MPQLTANQVMEVTGAARRTVLYWCSKSCKNPFQRIKKGRNYLWDAEKLLAWLHETGKERPAAALADWLESVTTRPKTTKPATVPTSPPGQMDIFSARDLIARMLVQAVEELNGCKGREMYAASKSVRETAEALRKLELDSLTVNEKLKKVLPFSFSLKIIGRILANARTNIMSLRYAMSQDLAAMTDEQEIDEYLADRFTGAMRDLEESFLKSELEQYEP